MIKITYFVHATTTDNENHLSTGWMPGELSAVGIEQAKKLGKLVKDKKFDAVFCSDLKRAVDSAHLAFGDRFPIVEDKRWREIDYGDFTLKKNSEFKGSILKYIDKKYPNGESYQDVANRVKDFLDEIRKKYSGKHIAVVAHHAPQLALEVLCNKKTFEQAAKEDWRNTKSWQPGWEYQINY